MSNSFRLDIGVKKTVKLYQILVIVLFVISVIALIVFGCIWLGDYDKYEMAKNGVEVEAKITEVQRDMVDTDDSWYYTWHAYYKYVSPENVSYSGVYRSYLTQEEGEKHIGDIVTITINPNNGKSSTQPLSYFIERKDDVYRDFTVFCALCCCFLVIAAWFSYRVIYRKIIDEKILKRVKCSYVGTPSVDGEVVCCIGLFWFYIKIRYYDDEGIAHEKWSHELFSRKEALFLREKQFIRIVPYKNTYGVLEEMPVKIKTKKEKTV